MDQAASVAPSSGLLKATNILVYVITVAVNGLAGGTTILGGKTTAAISNSYPAPHVIDH